MAIMKSGAAFFVSLLFVPSTTARADDSRTRPSHAGGDCLPAAGPLLDVKANARRHRLPLTLRLLGFSRTGRIALLEQRAGEETEGALWFVRIIDLDSDRTLVERQFETKANTTDALCRTHANALESILATHEIDTSKLPTLSSFPITVDKETLAIELRRRAKDEGGITRHEVWLKAQVGSKKLGVLRELDSESGYDPIGPPSLVGALWSPWERRLAVFIRQDETGPEAVVAPAVRVMGARLDSRWQER